MNIIQKSSKTVAVFSFQIFTSWANRQPTDNVTGAERTALQSSKAKDLITVYPAANGNAV
jgi:hypothetical protein